MQKTPYKYLPPLGQLITKRLFEDGISQAELARQSEISPQHLSNIITGKSSHQLKTIKKLSIALDIPFKEFIEILD